MAFWCQTGQPMFEARFLHARQRTLPGLDRIIPARQYAEGGYLDEGQAVIQSLDIYPDGHLLYKPQEEKGAWIQIPFVVKKKQPQRLVLVMTRSYDFGIYQAYLDGEKLGSVMDLYSEDITSREYHLLDFWPDPGQYTLRLEYIGKNPRSPG